MSAQTAPEPTMEDILASIRKIISDDSIEDAIGKPSVATNDSEGTKASNSDGTGNQPQLAEPETDHAAIPSGLVERRQSMDELSEIDIENSDKPEDLRAVETTSKIDTNSQPQRIVPEPGAISGRRKRMLEAAEENLKIQAPLEDNVHPAIANAMAYVNIHDSASDSGHHTNISEAAQKPVFSGNANIPQTMSGLPLVSPDSSERRETTERRNHPLRRGADRDDVEFKTALMSPATNNSISSSFEQLKTTATDNLDDKVTTLLRPMLREWLDNNLPSMVERLVRDEIERVSRGE